MPSVFEPPTEGQIMTIADDIAIPLGVGETSTFAQSYEHNRRSYKRLEMVYTDFAERVQPNLRYQKESRSGRRVGNKED